MPEEPTKTGRKSIPMSLIRERRIFEVGLKRACLATATIQRQTNALAVSKNWGTVSKRTVELDIAKYYRENKVLTTSDYDHLEQMREALLEQMELNIERASLNIRDKKKKWKSFEYQAAIDSLNRLQMSYMETQNWNLGRKNMNVNIGAVSVQNIFDSASADMLKAPPKAVLNFIKALKSARDEMQQEEARVIELDSV